MDDKEALLAIVAGADDEQARSRAWLFDRYHARLVAALSHQFYQDEDCANAGAADAFLELFQSADKEVPTLLDRPDEPWRWLLRRARDRTRDHRRRVRNIITGIPKTQKARFAVQDIDDHEETLASTDDPVASLASKDQARAVRALALDFLSKLEHPDRGVFLHDLVMRYGVLTADEAAGFDDEIIGRTHEDFTIDALKKRRQRLNDRLRAFLQERLP